jgi:ClpP class serine protease
LRALVQRDKEEHARQKRDPLAPSPHDILRRKYLKALTDYTGHPAIVYGSGWLEGRPVNDQSAISVGTRDMMGFMEAVHGLPRGPLDLVLHSPGGDQDCAEALMKYLRDERFGPLRAIVSVAAMSAATMMALCCDEILMGHHSQLGPIDPQFTLMTPEGPRSAPAQAILDQFRQESGSASGLEIAGMAASPIARYYLGKSERVGHQMSYDGVF